MKIVGGDSPTPRLCPMIELLQKVKIVGGAFGVGAPPKSPTSEQLKE